MQDVEVAKLRARRDEPLPLPDQVVVRGILGDAGLDPSDLRDSAVLNYDLYGFHGISVWIPNDEHPRDRLERTKLVKFDRYAQFVVADVVDLGLELWATGQSPHYDVVYPDTEDVDSLVRLLTATPYRLVMNVHADREEQ